jgi:hypothetical protein
MNRKIFSLLCLCFCSVALIHGQKLVEIEVYNEQNHAKIQDLDSQFMMVVQRPNLAENEWSIITREGHSYVDIRPIGLKDGDRMWLKWSPTIEVLEYFSDSDRAMWKGDSKRIYTFEVKRRPLLKIDFRNQKDLRFRTEAGASIIYNNDEVLNMRVNMAESANDVYLYLSSENKENQLTINHPDYKVIEIELQEQNIEKSNINEIALTLVPKSSYESYLKAVYAYQLGYFEYAYSLTNKILSEEHDRITFSEWPAPNILKEFIRFEINGYIDQDLVNDIYIKEEKQNPYLAALAAYLIWKTSETKSQAALQKVAKAIEDELNLYGHSRYYFYWIHLGKIEKEIAESDL